MRSGGLWRYGFFFFLAYLALFLRMHVPIPFGGKGILALEMPEYINTVAALNPFARHVATANNQSGGQIGLFFVLAVLTIGYLHLIATAQRDGTNISLKHILLGIGLFSVPLLLLPYLFSTDVHIYVFYGRISAVHGANPVFTPPSAFASDVFFRDVYPLYQNTPSVYGPVWMLLSHVLTLLVEALGGAQWLYLAAYKINAFVFHVASTVLLWSVLGRWRPQQQAWGTLVYAWSPLALTEFVGSAHNDGVMVFLILFAIWLAQREYWRAALVALVGATLVKWVAIVLLPLYVVAVLRMQRTWSSRLIMFGQIMVISALAAAVCYLPFGSIGAAFHAFTTMPAMTMSANSLSAFIHFIGEHGLPAVGMTGSTQLHIQTALDSGYLWLARGLVAITCLGALVAAWCRPTIAQFVASSSVIFIVVLATTSWFWPWYLIWPLAFAPLLDWKPLGRIVTIASAMGLMVYIQIGEMAWFLAALAVVGGVVWAFTRWLRLVETSKVYDQQAPDMADVRSARSPSAQPSIEYYQKFY